jgi:hypothetical protein
MRFKIPNTDNLYIDEHHQITSDDGEIFNLVLDCRGEKALVDIPFKTGTQRVSVLWLYLYARSQTPEFVNIDHVIFYHIPEQWSPVPWRAMYTRPYWYDKEHRIVPMCPSVAVSKTGDAVKVKNGKSCYVWDESYRVLKAFLPMTMKTRYINLHMLVANAWILQKQSERYPCVNHIDGNKLNPCADNLEWISFKGNAEHARDHQLLSAKSCRLRHKDTGEILEFPSIKEVARFLGRLPDHLYIERVPLNHLFNGSYEMRLQGDTREWLYLPENEVMNDSLSRYIYKVRVEGQKTKIFNGTRAVVDYYNLTDDKIELLSRGECLKRFRYKYPSAKIEVIDQWPPKKVQVMNVKTGKVEVFDTSKEVMEKYHLTRNVVAHSLRREGKVPTQGYRIRYYTTKPWPQVGVSYDRVTLAITNKLTNERKEYPSLMKASRDLGISPKLIWRYHDRPKESDTYTVEVIEGSETK